MDKPDSKTPLKTNEWITVRTPMGEQITLYRSNHTYRVTAIDCYTRRLREPATFTDEKPGRGLARVWLLELLHNHQAFEVEVMRDGMLYRYTVDLEAKS